MSISLPPHRQNSCPQIDMIKKRADSASTLIKRSGAIALIATSVFNSPAMTVCGICFGLSWLACRTVSYLCTKDSLLDSDLDRQCGLKISDQVKVVAFSVEADEICKAVRIANSDLVITKVESTVQRIEFVASKDQIGRFLSFYEVHRKRNIKYNFSPLYDYTSNNSSASLSPSTKFKLSRSSSKLCINLNVSPLLNLVTFSPLKGAYEVHETICNNRKELVHSQPTFTEEGNIYWERSDSITERAKKITTEIHRRDLFETIFAIESVHADRKVNYEMNLLYEISNSKTPVKSSHTIMNILHKIYNYGTFLLLNRSVNPKLSNNLKLIVYSDPKEAHSVRYIIEKNREGSNESEEDFHCSFSIQTSGAGKIRIETIVAKTIFRTLVHALKTQHKNIVYTLQPMFERIDTPMLKQMQNPYLYFVLNPLS